MSLFAVVSIALGIGVVVLVPSVSDTLLRTRLNKLIIMCIVVRD